jgi:hypothetical protein
MALSARLGEPALMDFWAASLLVPMLLRLDLYTGRTPHHPRG